MREQAYSEKNEKLNKKAARYIRELASEKGKNNLTVATFCQWINENMLPNETFRSQVFQRRLPRRQRGSVLTAKKGSYVDGHEHYMM